jgi:hypothetical protein
VDAEARFEGMTLEEGGQVVAVGSAEQQSSGRLVVVVATYLRNGHLNTAFSGDGRPGRRARCSTRQGRGSSRVRTAVRSSRG